MFELLRLTLLEKGVTYKLEPVDIFAEDGKSEEHLKRHPFGKIPAFSHNRLKDLRNKRNHPLH